jgi:hypothetical protein
VHHLFINKQSSFKFLKMETFKQVTLLLEKLQNDWDRSQGKDKISRIDKDILIQDIRQLYELVHKLSVTSDFSWIPTPEKKEVVPEPQKQVKHVKVEETVDEPMIHQEIKEETVSEEPDSEPEAQNSDTEEPEKNQKKQVEHVKDEETVDEPKIHQEIKEEAVSEEPDSEPETQKSDTEDPEKNQNPDEIELEIVAETEPVITLESEPDEEISNETSDNGNGENETEIPAGKAISSAAENTPTSKILADLYRENGDNSLAAKMQHNKISDLKTAIGINEKFLFINEIFKGETGAYIKAIDDFNAMTHYHEALAYLDQVRQENDVKNEAACMALIEILKRKFR